MIDGLEKIKTKEDLGRFLSKHAEHDGEYDEESKRYLYQLCDDFGLSRYVLRTHYDLPKKEKKQ